jgi:hypothetical protein
VLEIPLRERTVPPRKVPRARWDAVLLPF